MSWLFGFFYRRRELAIKTTYRGGRLPAPVKQFKVKYYALQRV